MSDHLIWLVGAGGMAVEYARVLEALSARFEVIGRGAGSAARFTEKTGRPVRLDGEGGSPHAAIVATPIETLAPVASRLIERGVRRLLVEKPAGLDLDELRRLDETARAHGAEVFVGYNRRFYGATQRARQILDEDGGPTSFSFDFTEWSHEIVGLPIAPEVKQRWVLANSSHVLDLAFHLGGLPRELDARVAGSLPWHSRAVFAGSGISEKGALFAYHANWAAPGRWGVEVMTAKRRLIFRPMEKLQVMPLASVAISEEPLPDDLDRRFKPGLYRQTEAFLQGGGTVLPTLAEHRRAAAFYARIAGYD
jgi:predicted dehydrogenase